MKPIAEFSINGVLYVIVPATVLALLLIGDRSNTDDKRARLVARALEDVGKPGIGPIAAADVGYSVLTYKAWCQLWVLYQLRLQNLTNVKWIVGKGFVGQLALPITNRPKPGDLAYWHTPLRHMAIVVRGGPDAASLVTVDGAQEGNTVAMRTHTTEPTLYYSIEKLLKG